MMNQSSQQQQTRRSIRTNIKYQSPFLRVGGLMYWALLLTSLMVVVWSLVGSQDSGVHTTKSISVSERSQLEQRISNEVIGQYNREQLQKLQQENMLNIPIATKKAQCGKKNQHQLHEQLQQNVQIFKIFANLGKQPSKQAILGKYFTKILPLSAVKHHKFTSPRHQHNKISIILYDWVNPFYNREDEEYNGVNNIFVPNNRQPWRAHGSYLTLVSDQLIKVSLIRLQVPSKEREDNEKGEKGGQSKSLYIFGLSALDTALTNMNTLQTTLITKSLIRQGMNQIQCDKLECNMEYSMIMLMVGAKQTIQITKLEVYKLSEQHNSNHIKYADIEIHTQSKI